MFFYPATLSRSFSFALPLLSGADNGLSQELLAGDGLDNRRVWMRDPVADVQPSRHHIRDPRCVRVYAGGPGNNQGEGPAEAAAQAVDVCRPGQLPGTGSGRSHAYAAGS